jgi:hypothetical protein
LKKGARSDKVAIVDGQPRLIVPFAVGLSPADVQVLERILAEWDTQGVGCPLNSRKIVDLALRRLQWELYAGCQDEVIEDVRREIAYRQWCAKTS